MPLRYIVLTIFLIAVCASSPARAATLYVSSTTGSDTSPDCLATVPCKTIAHALSESDPNDTITCLGPVSEPGLNIIKSIEIDCSAGRAILRDGQNADAITINIAVSSSDPLRTVRLRGFSIVGFQSLGFYFRGIDIQSAAAVYIDDVTITYASKEGILDQRTGGPMRLYVSNSTIRHCSAPGIVVAAAAPAATVLDNVHSENNTFGLAAAAGNNVVINRSVMSGNSIAGVEGDGGSQIVVNNSTISHNGIGVQSVSSVRISNNDIAFNTTAVSGAAGTFGNNRFSGNTSAGTPPTPLGGASSDFAQQ